MRLSRPTLMGAVALLPIAAALDNGTANGDLLDIGITITLWETIEIWKTVTVTSPPERTTTVTVYPSTCPVSQFSLSAGHVLDPKSLICIPELQH